jgi:hypothetical protein
MGAALFGRPLSVTSTAQSLTTLLGLSAPVHIANFVLRAAIGNSDVVWLGKSNVTPTTNQCGYLQPEEGLALDLNMFLSSDEAYLVAASPQTIYAFGIQ